MTLETIAKEVKKCKKCLLWRGRKNAVPGEGSAKAEIMFVGEGPGKNEDLQGRPFVGQAGKFLEEMLGMIGLKRQDVFITNVVKCRPPLNREPQISEIEICQQYLDAQIKIIKPKLIVILGRHSLAKFLPGFSISKIHGQPKRRKGQVYLPLYHPAVALYRGGLKKTLIADFQKIPKILAKI